MLVNITMYGLWIHIPQFISSNVDVFCTQKSFRQKLYLCFLQIQTHHNENENICGKCQKVKQSKRIAWYIINRILIVSTLPLVAY